MITSALCFAIMSAMIRLSGDLPIFEKVFFRNLIILFPAFYSAVKSGQNVLGKKENRKYLLVRALFGVVAVVTYFYAVDNLLLADSAMLNRMSPFFVTVFAYIFLREKFSRLQIPALLIVFLAALLIIKPKFDAAILPAVSGFFSAIMSGAAYTMLRILGSKEKSAVIILYFASITIIIVGPLMLLNYKIPTGDQLMYLILTGVFAAGGQFWLTLSYRFSKASEVSIYNYTNIIFASIVGFIIWREISDMWSLIGGAIIIATSAIMFLHNRGREF